MKLPTLSLIYKGSYEKQEDSSMPFSVTGTEEKVAKKVEKSEYEGFANGFPAWNLEPPQVAVRRKK